MRDFRRLLSLGVGGGLFVLLAGADGTCGAGSGVATCTKDAVTVLLNPGECTPIPSCAQGGYFDAASWSVAFAQTTPDWLTLGFDTLDFLGKPVANVCAGNGAPRGTDLNLKIAGTASGREANTEIKVHIRSTSSMDVQLKVPGAPIVIGRTLVSSGENTPVVAVAMTGSLLGREGDWNLGEATATAGPGARRSSSICVETWRLPWSRSGHWIYRWPSRKRPTSRGSTCAAWGSRMRRRTSKPMAWGFPMARPLALPASCA